MMIYVCQGQHCRRPFADAPSQNRKFCSNECRYATKELTPREIEILEHVANGLTRRAIAGRLGVTYHTVKCHMETIFSKLGALSAPHAVMLAMKDGTIHP